MASRRPTIKQRAQRAILTAPFSRIRRFRGTNRLQMTLINAYRMTGTATATLERDIQQQQAVSWQRTINDLLGKQHCVQRARPPSGGDKTLLDATARRDAESITNTYNTGLENEINRLWAQDPSGSRSFFTSGVQAWAGARDQHKQVTIANQNTKAAAQVAMERFHENNDLDPRFIYDGPPPAEADCAAHFLAGTVDFAHTQANPQPEHINCPHQWVVSSYGKQFKCEDLWFG